MLKLTVRHFVSLSFALPSLCQGASTVLVDAEYLVYGHGNPSSSKAAAATHASPQLYLFGGRRVTTREMMDDLYALDLETMTWRKVQVSGSARPQKRYFHSCDYYDGYLLVFGGMGNSVDRTSDVDRLSPLPSPSSSSSEAHSVLSDVAAFNLATSEWELDFASSPASPPSPRYAHLSAISGRAMVVVGGQDAANQYVDQLNILDLERRQWTWSMDSQRQCGSYRSFAVSSPFVVEGYDRIGELSKVMSGASNGGGRPRAYSNTTNSSSIAPLTPSSLGQTPGSSGLPSPAHEQSQSFDRSNTSARDGNTTHTGSKGLRPLPMSRLSTETNKECPPVYIYSNFNFTDVKRELVIGHVRRRGDADGEESDTHKPTYDIDLQEHPDKLVGVTLPPGLRFPTGVVVGDHLIVSGTYLANTSRAFSIWSLNLTNRTWSRIDAGTHLQSGSWNRAALWPRRNQLLVFGNASRDLLADYNNRRNNWDHVVTLDLEAWGVSQPPRRPMSDRAMMMGLAKLDAAIANSDFTHVNAEGLASVQHRTRQRSLFADVGALKSIPGSSVPALPHAFGTSGDFEMICSDGARLGCDRAVLETRWPWFARKLRHYEKQAKAAAEFVIARRAGTEDDASPPSADRQLSSKAVDCRFLPRHLSISEPWPVVMALLQFLYTRCICTPLQRHPAIVASLLILSRIYDMQDSLGLWARHAAAVLLTGDLLPAEMLQPRGGPDPASTPGTPTDDVSQASAQKQSPAKVTNEVSAIPVEECHRLAILLYEASGLAGAEILQLHAVRAVVALGKHIQRTFAQEQTTSGLSTLKAVGRYADGSQPRKSAPAPLRLDEGQTLPDRRPPPNGEGASVRGSSLPPASPLAAVSAASETRDIHKVRAHMENPAGPTSKAERLLGLHQLEPESRPGVGSETSTFERSLTSGNIAGGTMGRPLPRRSPSTPADHLRPDVRSTSGGKKRFSILRRGGGGGGSFGHPLALDNAVPEMNGDSTTPTLKALSGSHDHLERP